MRRAWLSLLILLGLAAASAHAPAMALPEPAAAPASGLADCHAGEAAAATDEPAAPACCPDGCKGGCLLPGIVAPARAGAERIPVRSPLPAAAVEQAERGPADGMFHPPRAFA